MSRALERARRGELTLGVYDALIETETTLDDTERDVRRDCARSLRANLRVADRERLGDRPTLDDDSSKS